MNKIISLCFIMVFSLLFSSCVMLTGFFGNSGAGKTASSEKSKPSNNAGKGDAGSFVKNKSTKEINDIQKKLVEGAEKLKGAKSLTVRGRNFNLDCSGTVAAIYYYAGIDLQEYYPYYKGTGTERIYAALKERKLLKKTWLLEPGDIIFWDNTFDRNNNNKDDDLLTHMGMVVSCDKQGNITYIHYNYARGIVYEYMNIRYKNYETQIVNGKSVTINSPMRQKGGSRTDKNWLAGQLINSSAEAYHLD